MNLDRLYHLKESGFYPNTILDIGASAGFISLQLKEIWPDAKILLIEANPILKEHLEKTNLPFLIRALGKENGESNFYLTKKGWESTGNSLYRELSDDYNDENVRIEKIKTYKLDDVLANIKTNTFDFIKIDTQGSELDILSGGLETLKKAKYVMIETSILKYNEGGQMIGDAFKFMNNNRFKMIDIIDLSYKEDNLAQIDLLFKNEQ